MTKSPFSGKLLASLFALCFGLAAALPVLAADPPQTGRLYRREPRGRCCICHGQSPHQWRSHR